MHIGLMQHIKTFVWLGIFVIASGCASAAPSVETGIRAGFESSQLGRIAVLPFSASDPFGLEPEALGSMLGTYETASIAHLVDLGSDVITPAEVRANLEQDSRVDELEMRLDLGRPLDELFEGSASGPLFGSGTNNLLVEDRNAFLKELGERLKVETVLLGEVVYHTDARCEASSSSKYTPYIVVEGEGKPVGASVPCVISHFHAKLVDVRKGETVWYNRVMREVRASSSTAAAPDAVANARAAVALVLIETQSGLRSVFVSR